MTQSGRSGRVSEGLGKNETKVVVAAKASTCPGRGPQKGGLLCLLSVCHTKPSQ